MRLKQLLKEWVLENFTKSDKLEEQYFELNEIKIDPLNSYQYEEIILPLYTKAYTFEDRCGNIIIAVYIESVSEFKTGYKVEGGNGLIFQPERLDNVEELIKPCPDEKKIGTIYKILLEEIIPTYLLNKKPNKLYFNPVSDSRIRLVDIIINKIIKEYPQLTKNNNYIVHI
jgi:hypothetical protein